jgi:transcriptional repressor NrdR
VSEADLAMLAQTVEETIRATGAAQVEAQEVGLAILGPLRTLDEVAFMRYASVYQGWETLEDFEAAIAVLKVERESQVSQAT